jgi:mannose-6-phosphate isomerase-like protein (cupin superfamily)
VGQGRESDIAMEIIRKEQTKTFQNGKSCVVLEYPSADKDLNGAMIEIDGRYPDIGRSVNEKCKEMAYVIAGFGKIVIEDEEILLGEGDLVLIEPGEKFYWDGNLSLFVPCTPAWTPEQYKKVDEYA